MSGPRDPESEAGGLEDLVETYLERRRGGEALGVEAFAAAHPEFGDQLRELLPGLVLLDTVAAETRAERPPERIGDFVIRQELGRGGMGVVYEAVQVSLGRRVALKVLSSARLADPEHLQRFRREAEVASRLDHPGICAVYAAGVERGVPYIAMRLVEGETLSRRIARRGAAHGGPATTVEVHRDAEGATPVTVAGPSGPPVTRDEIGDLVRLVEETARALHVAHEAGIVHRDVKPGNIMITPSGQPVVLDFGLARDLGGDEPTLTRTGDVFGTPGYMAPEQIRGGSEVIDRRCDVYALGVSLFETLALRRPFDGATREVLYRRILDEEPPALRRLNPRVPADLAVAVHTAMEKDRDRRYQTALDFAEDLRRVLALQPILARPPSAADRLVRWARRRPTAAALVGVLLLLAGVSGYLIAKLPAIRSSELQDRRERIETLLEKGFGAFSDDDAVAAAAWFDEVLALDPACLEASIGRSIMERKLGHPGAGRARLEALPEPARSSAGVTLLIADCLRAEGRAAEAAELEPAAGNPETALDHFLLGMRRLAQPTVSRAEAAAALEQLTFAVLGSPRARALYHYQRAVAAALAGDRKAVTEGLEVIPRLWPESAMAWHYHAYLLHGVPLAEIRREGGLVVVEDDARSRSNRDAPGREALAAAAAGYRKALALDDSFAPSHTNLAICLFRLGDLDGALQHFRRAVALAPTTATARLNLVRLLEKQGDLPGAERELREAHAQLPADRRVRRELGIILRKAGKRDEALEILQRGVAEDPLDAVGQVEVGVTLMDAGEIEAAVAAYRKAIDAAPDYALAWCDLGHGLWRQGKLDQAIGAFTTALEKNPDHALSRRNLAVALDEAGRPEDAAREYRTAFEREGRVDPTLLRCAARALFAAQDPDGAAKASREALELMEKDPADRTGLRAEVERELQRYLRAAADR